MRLSLRRSWTAFAAGGLLFGVGAAPGATVERRLVAMGTYLEVSVTSSSRASALSASEAAIREIDRVEDLLTTWQRGGELDRLNHAEAGREIPVSAELYRLLSEVFGWSGRTNGAFDPAIGPLVFAWDIRGHGRIPADPERRSATRSSDPENFEFTRDCCGVTREIPEAVIEEGAWGKGYALDGAARALEKSGVDSALVNLGGQILVLGKSPSGAAWSADVADPRRRDRALVRVRMESGSISTSGDSERSVTVSGRRIGHLLDPRSGEPAPDFGSATVLAPSGLAADVLSTAFFVLGPKEGMRLSEKLRGDGVRQEVLFLIDDRGQITVQASPGFSRVIEETSLRR